MNAESLTRSLENAYESMWQESSEKQMTSLNLT